jgi:hypothetical protein
MREAPATGPAARSPGERAPTSVIVPLHTVRRLGELGIGIRLHVGTLAGGVVVKGERWDRRNPWLLVRFNASDQAMHRPFSKAISPWGSYFGDAVVTGTSTSWTDRRRLANHSVSASDCRSRLRGGNRAPSA